MSLLRHHGARLRPRFRIMQSVTARRFYGLFYQWSRIQCLRIRPTPIRKFHSTPSSLREPQSLARGEIAVTKTNNSTAKILKKTNPVGARIWKPVVENELPAGLDSRPDLDRRKQMKAQFEQERKSVKELKGLEGFEPRKEGQEDSSGGDTQTQGAFPTSKAQLSQLAHNVRLEAGVEAALEPPEISTQLRKVMRALPASVVVITTALTTSAPSVELKPQERLKNFIRDGRGMTVSSFTTVTLTPHPVIQFNIKAPSRTLDALMETRHFLVHMLQAKSDGAAIAAAFSKGNSADDNPFLFPNPKGYRGYGIGETLIRAGTGVSDPKEKEKLDKAISWVRDESMDVRRPPGVTPSHYFVKKPITFEPRSSEQNISDDTENTIYLPRLRSRHGILRVLHCKVLDRGTRGGRGDGFVRVGDHMIVLARVHEILGRNPVDEISDEKMKALAYAHGDFTAARTVITPAASPQEAKLKDLEIKQEKERENEHDVIGTDKSSTSDVSKEIPDMVQEVRDESAAALTASHEHHSMRDQENEHDVIGTKKISTKTIVKEILDIMQKGRDKSAAALTASHEHHSMLHLSGGPRITKHVSQHGTSLEEVREAKEISKELGIPKRIAQEAIEALPDADAKARWDYSVLKAAEELAARKAEIEAQRLKAKTRSAQAESSSTNGDKKGRKPAKGPPDRPAGQFTVYKYKSGDAPLSGNLQPRIDQVWEKISRPKTSGRDLKRSKDEQDEFSWMLDHVRPGVIQPDAIPQSASEGAEDVEDGEDGEDGSSRTLDDHLRSPGVIQEDAMPESPRSEKKKQRALTLLERKAAKRMKKEIKQAEIKAKTAVKKERRRKRMEKSMYREPDPFADEFV